LHNRQRPAKSPPTGGLFAVYSLPSTVCLNQLCIQRNLRRLQQPRDRAAFLCLLRQLIELLFLDVGHPRPRRQVDLRHRRPIVGLLHRHHSRRLNRLRRMLNARQLPAKRHRKAPRMGRRDQLLRIGSHAILKPRAEAILRLVERPTLRADRSMTILQPAMPNCRCAAIHLVSLLSSIKLAAALFRRCRPAFCFDAIVS
jgi:hypothetical protein